MPHHSLSHLLPERQDEHEDDEKKYLYDKFQVVNYLAPEEEPEEVLGGRCPPATLSEEETAVEDEQHDAPECTVIQEDEEDGFSG